MIVRVWSYRITANILLMYMLKQTYIMQKEFLRKTMYSMMDRGQRWVYMSSKAITYRLFLWLDKLQTMSHLCSSNFLLNLSCVHLTEVCLQLVFLLQHLCSMYSKLLNHIQMGVQNTVLLNFLMGHLYSMKWLLFPARRIRVWSLLYTQWNYLRSELILKYKENHTLALSL